MKILITGGAGFIGSNTADLLINEGHDVIVFDDLSTGRKENVNPKATLVIGDIRDQEQVDKLFAEHHPEIVYHLAAQIDVRKSTANPAADANINIIGSLNVFNAAWQNKAKKIIFASTGGAIYGETEVRPTPETFNAKPISPYGVAKLTAENYLHYYQTNYNLDYVCVRYANVYGPRQNPHGEAVFVAIFSQKLLQGEKPIIFGSGEQTRDYVYVGDVASANLAAMGNSASANIFNVGTGQETSVNRIYQLLKEIINSDIEAEYQEKKTGEQMTSAVDNSLIKKELNWQPRVSLKDGLRQTIDWFKSNLDKI